MRKVVGRQSAVRAAHDDLEAALALVNETGALTYEALIHEELGRLHGDDHELQTALRLYRDTGAVAHARRLQAEPVTPSPDFHHIDR
jgi:hypothetical protein